MSKPKERIIVKDERPASIHYYPAAGHHIDISRCTLFVKVDGMYIPVPEAVATQFRSDEELAVHWGCPNRHGLQTAIIPPHEVPEVFYQTVEPDAKL
ncbi:hypothetical protein H6F89_25075 [Cyanobacteria bacterium FACHB-63]|nr:hypothetical protein [Cyanobacteria bacterium FACHB-63]